jgi:glycoside/pentoside/hexuronide:cation symporter, GPH family
MATIQEHFTAAEDRVPWNQLIAFGLGGLIPIALFNIVLQLVPLLGNISLGISAVWLGAILVLPRLWEALSDPVVGHLSDNARTRWGRRRPFILIGGIAVALSFVAMWWVPRENFLRQYVASDTGVIWLQLSFILGTLLVFFTACAVFEIPHGALGLEMSTDYHERTRLFSAKSFLGNFFAMGTPWLIFFASLEVFSGPGGNLVDGMRYVSMIIAAVLAPMAVWWFFSLREPGFVIAREQKKPNFFEDMHTTITNRTFLVLTAVIFTLAMGFNFVGSFANYITIFYLYGGDVRAASTLLGVTGTVWAVTALGAVFPLNWLGRRLGKNNTLLVAILLMCAAQLSKIVCYHPGSLGTIELPAGLATYFSGQTLTIEGPYLILIPTMLLSAGMLMFFTLGSSMVGDVCDEDELNTGTRSEGTYYSVFWWFIKMGTAFASLVMGALLVYTSFDERQNVLTDALGGNIAMVNAEAEARAVSKSAEVERDAALVAQAEMIVESAGKLRSHLENRLETHPAQAEHTRALLEHLGSVEKLAGDARRASDAGDSAQLLRVAGELLQHSEFLRRQSPETLFRLRLVEIGLPLSLSVVSILFMLRYPLTEQRCYEIKELLKQRRGELVAAT